MVISKLNEREIDHEREREKHLFDVYASTKRENDSTCGTRLVAVKNIRVAVEGIEI